MVPVVQGVKTQKKLRIKLIICFAAVLIVVFLTLAFYFNRTVPFRSPVLIVDGHKISMSYFLKRLKITGIEPMAMLITLMQEQIIKDVAPYPPYNIQIDNAEIDSALMQEAGGIGAGITGSEYTEWFRQQLNESRLSADEFRELIRLTLLRQKLNDYLVQRIPTVAEQVHLHLLPLPNIDMARQARERFAVGVEFSTLVNELALDEDLKSTGGDLGWFPRAALGSNIAEIVFDKIAVGEISEPVYLEQGWIALLMISERAAARTIDDRSLQNIKGTVLEEWFKQESLYHKVEFRGLHNRNYDSETDAWVAWQLRRMSR